ncbi:MAG: hypothetical protein VZS12_09160 [Ruminococcus bromii]|nr:hypothetical protein [Ruminococcus bromii]
MNYKAIRELQKEIKQLRAAQAAQANADEQTRCALEQSIINKTAVLNEIAAAIPDTYEGNIIRLKLNNHSWKSIAQTVAGNVNNHNALRAMIRRYNW